MQQNLYTYKNSAPDRSTNNNGPLANKRVLLQPNMSVRGWLCNAGSRALAGFAPLQDATVVSRLTAAGVVLTGSARMGELGFGLSENTIIALLSQTQAPDVAIVSDIIGEARLAAAGAGFYGFKPSYGLISRFGWIGLVPSMECCGIVAADPALIMDTLAAIAGADPNDPTMPDDGLAGFNPDPAFLTAPCTAGVIKESLNFLSAEERREFDRELARLAAANILIKEVNLSDYALFRDVHHVIAAVEASSGAGKYDGVRYGHRCPSGKNWNEMYLNTRGESFGTLIKSFLFQGAYFQFENYPAFENACRIRAHLLKATTDLLAQVDLLVTPTRCPTHDPARTTTIDAVYDAFVLTLPANVTGQPALHVPVKPFDAQSTVGVQLMGLRMDDARLLSIGMRLSSTTQEGK